MVAATAFTIPTDHPDRPIECTAVCTDTTFIVSYETTSPDNQQRQINVLDIHNLPTPERIRATQAFNRQLFAAENREREERRRTIEHIQAVVDRIPRDLEEDYSMKCCTVAFLIGLFCVALLYVLFPI